MEQVRAGYPIRLTLAFLLFAGRCTLGTAADAPVATLHTRAAEVRLTFSVSDESHRAVATLSAKDFAVVDKDVVVRDFRSFSPSERTRLEVAALVDTSESVTPNREREMAALVELLGQTGGVPEEDLSVVSFQGVEPVVVCAGNCRASHAADQLTRTQAGGLTPLFDAIVFATRLLAQRADEHARKVLIVFSDGEDTISRQSAADALTDAVNNEVEIYTIDLNRVANLALNRPSNRTSNATRGSGLLEALAGATGGQAFGLQDGVSKAVDAVLADFHAEYVVTYKLPSQASGFHVVRILPTHNQNLEFHCRRGYYYQEPVVPENAQ